MRNEELAVPPVELPPVDSLPSFLKPKPQRGGLIYLRQMRG